MSKQYCIYCFVIILNTKLLNAANIPLRPSILPTTSTYKPSTLLLPPGFDSQKPPRQPMLYPYAVPSAGLSTREILKNVPTPTPDWIPVALSGKNDMPLIPISYSTTPTLRAHSVSVLKDLISLDDPKYSPPSYNDGPVFESIVYGTWKPDPPLQPVKLLNDTHQSADSNSNMSNNSNNGLVVDGKVYNKTINRQHGGFIGHIQPKPTKSDRQSIQVYKNYDSSSSSTTAPSVDYKPKESTEMSSEQKLQKKVKVQGRQKIRPISSTTEPNSIDRSSHREESATTAAAANENFQRQQSVIKLNSTDPKLMEVVKQINESTEIKYNHKQTSPHSIEVMTTENANNNDDYGDDDDVDELGVLKTKWASKSTEFWSTEPQPNYDDDIEETFQNINATRREWPTDFMDEPLTTTEGNFQSSNNSDKFLYNDSLETDPSEIPLALSAFNIPPSLWPKLPGNITKLGKPYKAQSSAEEPALCVPITVREQNMMNSHELVYIERVFCFPMPLLSTTSENSLSTLENTITTFRTVTKTKVRNFDDFVDSNLRVSNTTSSSSSSSSFKNHLYLVVSVLFIYFKFII